MNAARVSLDDLADVSLDVRIVLGRGSAKISDVLAYAPGSVVSLDVAPDAPVALLVNGVAVAEGDLVLADDGTLGVEILRVISGAEGAAS
ncbi:MAG TPA: FliM/FliN family flagellar motor switch protein [Candidatus Eremiobacteraceae bacterium]|nr:FliM/FliN family flagellar motor switch protein [Candidatus Eremiobacteraceae bacterium]